MFAATVLLLTALSQLAVAGDKLYMWQVESETATVTLVGSIHVGQADFFPLAAPFEEAFAAAPVLAVEVDMTDQNVLLESSQIMMKRGMLPGDETLETRLDPKVYARLVAHAEEVGSPLAMYMKFKPGIVAMIMVMEEYQRQGLDPELGIDKHFLDAAKAADKEVRALEKVSDQLDIFLDMDDSLDDIMMAEFLDQVDDIQSTTDEMIALWRTGDADGMDEFMQSQMGEGPEMEEFYRKLITDRNIAMTDKIVNWLGEDQDVFVVVGAAHYSGGMGIVALLEAKGWSVTQAEQ
jgi:uncharacterized protein YbaP (TraB family)